MICGTLIGITFAIFSNFQVDFPSQRDLEDHLDEQHCLCEPCKRYFPSAYELGQHDIQCHNWCNICDRYFRNENNYACTNERTTRGMLRLLPNIRVVLCHADPPRSGDMLKGRGS
ncbi:hypothetical protein IFM61392_10130 [Aspergillus lentulus]|uniref:C2H2-type domain-containing protein n=1 Tax=Aspergillus lentulus TaxID=293939 RepID=A0ABQ1ABT1_ASPLE|nr:hypothetical protein IFM62136_04265 [Aspergillus lentulus]GFF78352.1 hypothetical protein IFM60648_05194 [Aspergillus lentulus]GFF96960.1 hypothetical protein IFM47457_11152 [Aspergillus lentulus]GFG17618.1 hypothetical protein IFM61392_10130 [Aspergillus lentulus]